jgi:phage FluMu protein Com
MQKSAHYGKRHCGGKCRCSSEDEFRCPDCGKLLLKGDINSVQVKCPRCKSIVSFNKTDEDQESRNI